MCCLLELASDLSQSRINFESLGWMSKYTKKARHQVVFGSGTAILVVCIHALRFSADSALTLIIARVDSESPIYQLFDKELYEDFTFSERYPGWLDIRRYFRHVEKKWNVEKHITYSKCVDTAIFDEKKHMWLVECSDESQIYCRWFIPCLGFASKHYRPPFPGLGNFRGETYHSGQWPLCDVNLKNKRVALIGTGASGIQIAQEIGPKVKHLTLYQRSESLPSNEAVEARSQRRR